MTPLERIQITVILSNEKYPLAKKFQNIRLEAEGVDFKDQVRATHIIPDYHRVSEMRSAIKKIYDHPGSLGYPLG